MQRSHQILLDPTFAQERYFTRACGVSRFTWNFALAEWQRQYAEGGKPSGSELKRYFNAIRHVVFPWTDEVLRDATSQPFANLQSAFTRFFKKQSRFPKFKKKGVHDSFYMANDRIEVDGQRIRVPRLGWVRMHEALRFTGKILSAVVSRIADKWFVSIAVDTQVAPAIRENQAVVGVDLGIKTLATLSTGERFDAPKPLAWYLDKLRRLNRALSRKQKGSRNRWKAREQLARLHYRIGCIRRDTLHKLTTYLTRTFGTIVLEDLNVAGMVKNRHLSRAISDLGLFEFRRQVEYKSEANGSRVIIADRWFPSSKLCSACGYKLDDLPLSVREWTCPKCGVIHDRDDNASQNLKQLGQAMPEVTPVETEALARPHGRVKLPSVKQELCRARLCAQES